MYAVMEKYEGMDSEYDFSIRPFKSIDEAFCYVYELIDAAQDGMSLDKITEVRIYEFKPVNNVYDAYYIRESEVKL